MHYKGYDLKALGNQKPGLNVFERGTSKRAWVCSSGNHPERGPIIAVERRPCVTIREAKSWINGGFAVENGQQVVFASTREEAEQEMQRRLSA